MQAMVATATTAVCLATERVDERAAEEAAMG